MNITTTGNTINTVKEFLEHGIAYLQRGGIPPSGLNGYYCPMDFVLKNGRQWKPGKVCWAKGRSACYIHAAKAAMRNRDYTFVEGYACMVLPVPHAWLVDKDGLVIETTWDRMGADYYGIPFRTGYVRQQVRKHGCYSMIDQWNQGDKSWETIKTDKEKWFKEL